MKVESQLDTASAKTEVVAQSSVKVCIHLVKSVRAEDVRTMRAARALVEAGFTVSIVDVEHESTGQRKEDIHGVHLEHIIIPDWWTSRVFEPWFFIKAVYALVLSVIRLLKTRADIYQANEGTALPACYFAARLSRKPLIFEAYELPPAETSIAFWRWLHGLFTYFLARVIPRCAGVIAVSPPIAQEIHNRYHGPEVTVIRNVPAYRAVAKSDRLRQRLGLRPEVRIALYQGALQENRGPDTLVRAAPFLDPNTVIVLMGMDTGKIRAELEALIAKEGVADRVKILPPVPYEELLDWTASADIGLIIFSPDRSLNVKMCLPNKLFEYLMVGLPVLASELIAVVEVLKTYDAGQLVSSFSPAAVGAAINTMLADRIALERMRCNALRAAQDYCWEKESQHFIRLYQEILAK